MTIKNANLPILGWKEWCSLPGLSIPLIKAKIDTGAQTSSLHAYDLKTFRNRGKDWIKFNVHPLQFNRSVTIACQAPIIDRRYVTSSNGQREKRYVISTLLQLGNLSFSTEVTLTDRSQMNLRLLLGRKSLESFCIYPFKEMCLGKYKSDDVKALYE